MYAAMLAGTGWRVLAGQSFVVDSGPSQFLPIRHGMELRRHDLAHGSPLRAGIIVLSAAAGECIYPHRHLYKRRGADCGQGSPLRRRAPRCRPTARLPVVVQFNQDRGRARNLRTGRLRGHGSGPQHSGSEWFFGHADGQVDSVRRDAGAAGLAPVQHRRVAGDGHAELGSRPL